MNNNFVTEIFEAEVVSQFISQESGEKIALTPYAPPVIHEGPELSCGKDISGSTCESDKVGDTCTAACEFGYDITYTCMENGRTK